MRDIFAPSTNGKYGIDGLKAGIQLANTIDNLVEHTYRDDQKLDASDLFDVASFGPALISQGSAFATKVGQLDEELLDLSEAEKTELKELSGGRLEKPGYRKILSGALDILDGIAELINVDNPTA